MRPDAPTPADDVARRRAATLTVFDLIYGIAGAVAAAGVVPWSAWKSRGDAAARARRLGRLGKAAAPDDTNRKRVMMHGVSVGEVKLLRPLLAEIARAGADVEPLLTSTTPAGIAESARLFPDAARAVYPIDFPTCPARFLERCAPRSILLMELELWPEFLRQAAARRIPAAVVNGRLSERSLRRFKLFPEFALRRLGAVSVFCMQSEANAERLRSLGVAEADVLVCGNMKFDGLPARKPSEARAALRARVGIGADELVVVGGSTHDPEESLLARAVASLRSSGLGRIRCVIVPRHVDRAAEIERGLTPVLGAPYRFSAVRGGVRADDAARPILVDTVGDLEDLYQIADVAFVGGSLMNVRGGQNMLEPAAAGAAVVHGSSVPNFEEAAQLLQAAGASSVVHSEAELAAALGTLLRDPAERASRAAKGIAALAPHRGASMRAVAALVSRGLL